MHDHLSEQFIHALCEARQNFALPRQARLQVKRIADGLLALLFPHFTAEASCQQHDIQYEIDAIDSTLDTLISQLLGRDGSLEVSIFWSRLPSVRVALLNDAAAIESSDPAARGIDDVILAYPGFMATAIYRLAHEFFKLEIPILPRLLTEYAHHQTGIDINAGAQIGTGFAIDHGTGVVIGETAVIGNGVRIYQGVTLGALAVDKSLQGSKRHPTIEDGVVIYANATILGGSTTVGENSVIGGNVWLTESVPPGSTVTRSTIVRKHEDALEFYI